MSKKDELINEMVELAEAQCIGGFNDLAYNRDLDYLLANYDIVPKNGAVADSSHESSGLNKPVVNGWPLEDFPNNLPLYLDSGLFQLRSDDMEKVLIQQGVNESNIDFLARCKAYR